MIDLTPKAAQHILASGKQALRLRVVPGGCAAYQYTFQFDKPVPSDHIIEKSKAVLVVDKQSLNFLKGATVDFRDSLMNRGFVVHNPNVKRTCACGHSVG